MIKPFAVGAFLAAFATVASADLPRLSPAPRTPAVSTRTPAPQADLVITALSWSAPPRAGQAVGQAAILNLQVRNRGAAAAAETQVLFQCRRLSPAGVCPAGLGGTRTLPPLAAGASTGLAWPDASTAVWSAGRYRIDVRLDPRNTVAEASETNNSRRLEFTVSAPTGAPAAAPRLAPKRVSPAEQRGINPQPEPPGVPAVKPGGFVSPTERKAINPQPEPPDKPAGGFVPAPMPAQPAQGAAPFTPKVATAPQLTITGRPPVPFKPRVATAPQLTITGRPAAPFKPMVATAAALTITGRAAPPFVPKSVTTPALTITGRPQ